jgi:hypothetical protein
MIFKTTLAITVLQEAESQEEAARLVAEIGLAGLAYEISEGTWIGMVSDGPTVEVPTDKVQAELLTIGNDGSFFDPI